MHLESLTRQAWKAFPTQGEATSLTHNQMVTVLHGSHGATNSHTLCSILSLRKDHSLSFIVSKWKKQHPGTEKNRYLELYKKSWQKDWKELFLSKQLSVTQWIKCSKHPRMFQGLKREPAERREIVMTLQSHQQQVGSTYILLSILQISHLIQKTSMEKFPVIILCFLTMANYR